MREYRIKCVLLNEAELGNDEGTAVLAPNGEGWTLESVVAVGVQSGMVYTTWSREKKAESRTYGMVE